MDDITSKITELLSDPQGMETIKNIAQSFMNQDNTESSEKGSTTDSLPFSPSQLGAFTKVISAFKSSDSCDERAALLIALKPHLSHERQEKTDNAIRILKLLNMLPLLQDSGIMSLLGGL